MPEEQNDNQIPKLDELEELKRQRDEYLSGWQRTTADFSNYKKDERKHFDEAVRYGIEGIVRDMIGVLDSFDLAIRALEKSGVAEKGIYLIRSQMEEVLKRRGVEKIPVAAGDPFDPATMEAMAEIESSTEPPGVVMEEIEAGYRFNDKIIRAARVAVSKGGDSD